MEVNCESVTCSYGLVTGGPKKSKKQINTDTANITCKHQIGDSEQSRCVLQSERTSSPLGWRDSWGAGFFVILTVVFTSLVSI